MDAFVHIQRGFIVLNLVSAFYCFGHFSKYWLMRSSVTYHSFACMHDINKNIFMLHMGYSEIFWVEIQGSCCSSNTSGVVYQGCDESKTFQGSRNYENWTLQNKFHIHKPLKPISTVCFRVGWVIFLPKTDHARLCRSNTANGNTASQQLLRLVLVLRDRRKVRVLSSVSSELLVGEVAFTLQAWKRPWAEGTFYWPFFLWLTI